MRTPSGVVTTARTILLETARALHKPAADFAKCVAAFTKPAAAFAKCAAVFTKPAVVLAKLAAVLA